MRKNRQMSHIGEPQIIYVSKYSTLKGKITLHSCSAGRTQ